MNRAHRLAELEHDGEIARSLENLKWFRVVNSTWRSERPAFEAWIGFVASRKIFHFAFERCGQVRNHVAFDNPGTWWRVLARSVWLEIEFSRACCLPNS